MKRSAEIEHLMREMVEAIDRGDIDALNTRTLSGEDGVVMIGTDPGEYSRSQSGMRRLLEDSTPDGPLHMHVSMGEVWGYEEGDVGWADGTGSFTRDSDTVGTRFTAVFRREHGSWRCVQAHASIGVPNDMIFDANLRAAKAGHA